MKLEELKTIEQLSQFIDGTQPVIFQISSFKKKKYSWIRHELVRFDYQQIGKSSKGIVIRYLMKVSGYSRQQLTRLIARYRETGYIKHYHANVPAFHGKYSKDNIRLLARVDQLYDTQLCTEKTL